MKIRQHIPSFVTGADSKEIEFKTVEELLDIDWIKSWAEPTDENGRKFYRWSIDHCNVSNSYDIRNTLMIEKDEGTWWWVVGYLDNDATAYLKTKLPEWKYVG